MADHVQSIQATVSEILSPERGFEVYPFLIGWYNEKVGEQYELSYDPSTLAFIVFSTPAMFDMTFKPFIRRQPSDQLEDPIDQCMIHHFNLAKEIGWYNEKVGEQYALPYDPSTLAFIVFSTPAMFDMTFKPFIRRQPSDQLEDPIDQCMIHHFNLVKEKFPQGEVETLHDFEMIEIPKRAKILVQTAGHVAGAAYYYQRRDVDPDPWRTDQKICGFSIHPRYGGWFSLRGVIIFKNVQQPELPYRAPEDCVPSREDRIKLLESFNHHWQDGTYRDIVPVQEKYSEEQEKFIRASREDRAAMKSMIREIRSQPPQ